MSPEAITQIILGCILIVGAIVGSYGIPLLKSAFEWIETNKLYKFIKSAVEWANQTIPPEEWKRKKEEVLEQCIDYAKNHIHIDFTDAQIDIIIEALVKEAKDIANKVKG